jgi:hypothetical protein
LEHKQVRLSFLSYSALQRNCVKNKISGPVGFQTYLAETSFINEMLCEITPTSPLEKRLKEHFI